jgi:4-amino-4-deoxychorismate lyase
MLLETVKIHKGEVINIELHNMRMSRSRRELFGMDKWEDIASLEGLRKIPFSDQPIKARIVYADKIIGVEWEFYARRVLKSLKIVVDNEIDYRHKYSDRARLNELLSQRGSSDDIIIVKNGVITDSSFSNLAFTDGIKWLTPAEPLLMGTKRQQLILEGRLVEEEIRMSDLNRFSKCSLINALNDLGDVEIECRSIR